MALLELTDTNLSRVIINTDHIAFVGPASKGTGAAVVLDITTPGGAMTVMVSNSQDQVAARWRAALKGWADVPNGRSGVTFDDTSGADSGRGEVHAPD